MINVMITPSFFLLFLQLQAVCHKDLFDMWKNFDSARPQLFPLQLQLPNLNIEFLINGNKLTQNYKYSHNTLCPF